MTIIDKDLGWNALGLRVQEINEGQAFVMVGIQGSAATATHDADSGMTNVELGTIHEFGLGVPRRSFIRDAIDEHQKDLATFMGKLGQRVLLGTLPEAYALELVGQQAVKIIQQRITAHIDPPLSEYTKKKKGSDVPLVETGTLRKSITYELGKAT